MSLFCRSCSNGIAEQGRHLLPRSLGRSAAKDSINELAEALLSGRGEASGVAIAREILETYRALPREERIDFLTFLARNMQPDTEAVARAARSYLNTPGSISIAALQQAVESPRQELLRRINMAPGGTAHRRDAPEVIDAPRRRVPQWRALECDLHAPATSWFNRGFLELRAHRLATPAAILEKIIAYEAVHEIKGWDDLRRRLDPETGAALPSSIPR